MKRTYLLRRLLQAFIVLIGVTLLIFVMLRIVPGNPIETMMGEHANSETIARMTAEMGLDQPLYVQFFRYISSAFRGDFGTSYSLGKPVSQLLGAAFANTLVLRESSKGSDAFQGNRPDKTIIIIIAVYRLGCKNVVFRGRYIFYFLGQYRIVEGIGEEWSATNGDRIVCLDFGWNRNSASAIVYADITTDREIGNRNRMNSYS